MKKKILLGTIYFIWGTTFLLALGGVLEIESIQPGDSWYRDEHSRYLKREWNTNIGYRWATYYMWASAATLALMLFMKSLRKDKRSRSCF